MAKTRKKHIKTEYEKKRDIYREASPKHVVTFEADIPEDMKRKLFSYAEDLRNLSNDVVRVMRIHIDQLTRTKAYRNLLKEHRHFSELLEKCSEGTTAYNETKANLSKINKELNKLRRENGVTLSATCKVGESLRSKYSINSIFVQARCEAIWRACETVLFGNGTKLHFKKRFDLPIIRAKQCNRGIPIKIDENGELVFSNDVLGEFRVLVPEKDLFLKDEYSALCRFLANPSSEEASANKYVEKGILVPVFRPCFAALRCETIRRKLRVYVQVTVAAEPMPKKNSKGEPRHKFGRGRIGCDNGPQSYAAVSNDTLVFANHAERNRTSTKTHEKTEQQRQRAIERSIRETNPNRFNDDGTPKKNRGPYKKSKHCRRLLYLVREQRRRDAASRKYAIQQEVNELRALGDELIIEPSNAKAMQKRSKKPAEDSKKTITIEKADGTTRTINLKKRKKRHGRSILHRCPGFFQSECKKKFGSGYHEVDRMFRASQYDHKLNSYVKKKLSERWHIFSDGTRVQRDVYSAFLMFCSDSGYHTPNLQQCLKMFDHFFELHEALIAGIIKNKYHVCNSGIAV
ncbi:MAG: hypothetical protein IJT08_03520 [Alphaproteobacteria bacterium]|nr:hypothetical protein [Alphaproteobacteria bacterium]